MSHAFEKRAKVDGLGIVGTPLESVVSHPKCNNNSYEFAKLNLNTKNGKFFLYVLMFWGTSAFVLMKTGLSSLLIIVCHLALLVLSFAATDNKCGLSQRATTKMEANLTMMGPNNAFNKVCATHRTLCEGQAVTFLQHLFNNTVMSLGMSVFALSSLLRATFFAKGMSRHKILLAMAVLGSSFDSAAAAPFTVDLSTFTPGAGARFIGSTAAAYVGHDIVEVGDHNGDGFADYAFVAPGLGKAIIVMKRNTTNAEQIVNSIVSGVYYRVIKTPEIGAAGSTVGGVGDINGDTFDDVIVGAATASYSGRGVVGLAFVIFGTVGPFTDLTLTNTWTASTTAIMIIGPATSSFFVSRARNARGLGDVNGDGVDDFALSAYGYPGTSAKTQPGVVWVIFGKTTPAFTNIDLLPANFGANGIYFTGAVASDFLGFSISTAGDFNKDGIADFLIGAPQFDPVVNSVSRTTGGIVYLIFGSETDLATTDMSTFVSGSKGVRFLGAVADHRQGQGLGPVGDVNGDGIDDIGFGAGRAAPLTRSQAGIVYIVYGTTTVYSADIDMLSFTDFTKGFQIYGSGIDMYLFNAAPAGDINGDGVGDILVGGAGSNTKAHLVFGQSAVRTANVDTATDDVITFTFTAGAYLGFAFDGGADFNGDGLPDILFGAYQATVAPQGGGTAVSTAGAVCMLPGPIEFPVPTVNPSVEPTAEPTILPSAEPTAQPSTALSVSPSVLPSVFPSLAPSANPSFAPSARPSYLFTGDLTQFTSDGSGARFIGSVHNSYVGQDVAIVGDHNGDGFADFVIGANGLSRAVIVMTRNMTLSEVDVATVVSSQYFRVVTGLTGSQTGMSVGGIGDINGDSFADVIVGAPFGQVSGRGSAGYAYVIFGMEGPFTDLTLTATWAASSLGFMILGPVESVDFVVRSRTARGLGDVNGDGVDDFAVSARIYSGTSGKAGAGVVWVIFGKTGSSFTAIDLLPANFGSSGIYFTGESSGDSLGWAISAAGDFNGDGVADILMGACEADPVVSGNTRALGGMAYLVYGSATDLATTDMSTFVSGSKGVRFLGALTDVHLGFSVGSVGDVNDDGFDDIALGAPITYPFGRGNDGMVYVVYGTNVAYSADVDLLNFAASSNGFVILGSVVDMQLCTAVPAGDINGDGVNDILVGGNNHNGRVHIVYGQTAVRTAPVDTETNEVMTFYFSGGSMLGWSLDGGEDLNGDGIPDILLGAYTLTVTPEDGGTAVGGSGAVWLVPGPLILTFPTAAPTLSPSVAPSTTSTARPTFLFTGDLTQFTSDGTGARFIGSVHNSYVGQDVAIVGDHNGDGFTDFIIGANGLSRAVIVMARNITLSEIDVATVVSSAYFRVVTGLTGSQTGNSVGGIGDINGDSFDDVIVGAPFGQVSGRGSAGYAYVIFGMEGPFTDLVLTDSWPASSLGFMILGPVASVEFIVRVRTMRGLGDVNGDGIDDFALSARSYVATSNKNAPGVVWVIFGKTGTSFTTIDLLPANFGNSGIYFIGANNYDSFGWSISKVGDFNGDGFADILVGACEADPVVNSVTRNTGGMAYLIYGSNTSLITTDMSTFVTGNQGVRFLGPESGMYFGWAVGNVGDVNDDGFDDIALGVPNAAPFGRSSAGTVCVIFGTNVAYTADVDLFNYIATFKGFAIHGSTNGFQLCTAAPAGDINGDGVNDILVGGYGGNSQAHIVYGRTEFRTSHVDTATNDVMTFSYSGGASLGWSLDGGEDLNGDGIPDLLLGAYTATVTPENGGAAVGGSGAVWLVPGPFILTYPTGAPTFPPTIIPSITPTIQPSNPTAVPTTRPSYLFTGDLTKFTSDGEGVRFIGSTANARVGNDVAIIGDHNGDGFTDFIISASGLNIAIIVMARNITLSEINVPTVVSGQYFRVISGPSDSQTGSTVGGVGDINGDSFDDVIVGAASGQVSGRGGAGYAYVIFGMEGPFTDLIVTATWTASSLGFMILGPSQQSGLVQGPRTARGLGDVNNDGIDDFAVVANYYAGVTTIFREGAGVVYVIFGKTATSFSTIDLLLANFGSNGVYFTGPAAYVQLGQSMSPAGDFNNDGIADFLMGANANPVVNGAARPNAGIVYLVYGSATNLTSTDMATFVTGTKGVRFFGGVNVDYLGFGVAAVGDVNGDGIDDIALGAGYAHRLERAFSGVVYVIYGTTVAYTEDVDMLNYNAFTKGFAIYGSSPYMYLNSAAPAGDINGDGMNDILVGGTFASTKAHIVYGRATRSDHVDTASNEVMTFSFTTGASLGKVLAGGEDLNGDGFPDILLAGSEANVTPENGGTAVASGVVWLLPGPFILTNPTAAPTHSPSVVPSASPSVYPTNPTTAPTARPSYLFTGDLTQFTSDGEGVRFIGSTTNARVGNDVAIVGDHNGDGFTDYIIGAPGLDKAIVVMTRNATLSEIDVSAIVSGLSFRVIIGPSGTLTGGTVGGVGDINGDTYDDVIVGAFGPEYAFVIFGMEGPFTDLVVTANWAASSLGFMITGPALSVQFVYNSRTARGLGDVNGDGIDDFAVSARFYQGTTGKSGAGVVWVIFGKTGSSFTTINLLPSNFDTNGVYFTGEFAGDSFGWCISKVGDFNGDGFADMLVGARERNPVVDGVTRGTGGGAYVIFGSTTLATTDMSTFVTGSQGIRFLGPQGGAYTGYGIGNVGDVNDDGFDDIAIGAPNTASFGRSLAGTVYVIFGTNVTYTADVDLFNYLPSSKGFAIYGSASGMQLCTAAPAGDINGDGVNDMLISGFGGDSKAHIVYGRTAVRTSNIDTATNDVMTFTFGGNSFLGWSLDGGEDLDGDGFPDILLGGYNANIAPEYGGTVVSAAGAVWMLSGPFILTYPTGAPTFPPTIVPSITPTIQPSNPTAVPTTRPSYLFTGDLTQFTSDGEGVRFIGSAGDSYVGQDVNIIGDHNGDGFTDFILSAFGLNKVIIVMTRNMSLSEINVASVVSGQYFRVVTGPSNSQTGSAASGIGDINGDGFDDVIVGAVNGEVTGRANAGFACVIFGMEGPFTDLTLTQSWAVPSLGFMLLSPGQDVQLTGGARTARGLGDVNGDGIGDFAVSAWGYSAASGIVWVIFGKTNTSFVTIDLEPANFGSNGVYYKGDAPMAHFGIAISAAGDFNGDGIADFLMSARFGDPVVNSELRANAGIAYLVYGSATGLVTSEMSDFVTGAKGVRFLGPETEVNLGNAVAGVGDINGDGLDDIALGATRASPFQRSLAGTVYIIYGTAVVYAQDVDMFNYGGFTKGFTIYGTSQSTHLSSAAPAGDINGDGVNDILVGGTEAYSKAHIVYGKVTRTDHVDTASNEVMTFSYPGYIPYLGNSLDGGKDLNGDGFVDILLGARYATVTPENGGAAVASGAVWLLPGPFILTNPTTAPTLPPSVAPSIAPTARPSFLFTGDLTQFTSDGSGARFIGSAANSLVGQDVAIIGDHNGDGFTDYIIGARGLDKAVIVMTRNSTLSEIDVASVASGQYFRVVTGPSNSLTGCAVGGIGDINGDSFDDVIIGASSGYLADRNYAGYAYVIFGMEGPFTDMTVTATWAASSLGFMILGPVQGVEFLTQARTARGLGDVNGDGIDDFAVSATTYPGTSGRNSAGVAYVLFGKTSPAFTTIDLFPANLGTDGVYFTGATASDYLGRSLGPAGDFNNDGIADFLFGSPYYDVEVNSVTRLDAGIIYLIFGSNTSLVTTDMATFVTGSKGVRFMGGGESDYLGMGCGAVGDVNGDGIDDIALGAERGDPLSRTDPGIVYIIYGSAVAYTADVDLLNYNAFTMGFAIYGSNHGLFLCIAAPAGDINGDGVNDIVVGGTRTYSKAHIVYGRTTRTAHVDTASNEVMTFSYSGNSNLGYALDGGEDLNGDGFPDILLGARYAMVTPEGGGTAVESGAVWLLPGPLFLTNPTTAPTMPPTVTPSCLPSVIPSVIPSASPSVHPSTEPSIAPSVVPSITPTIQPSSPTAAPTTRPSYLFTGDLTQFTSDGEGVRFIGSTSAFVGRDVAIIGDHNGDGFTDYIIAAHGLSKAIVVMTRNLTLSEIDLSTVVSGQYFRVLSGPSGSQTGISVGGIGDINGDSFDDVLVGAVGCAYVIFGMEGPFVDYTVNDVGAGNAVGFPISGVSVEPRTARGLGDVNGDGVDDFAVTSSRDAGTTGRNEAGVVWVIFGKISPAFTTIDLLPANFGTNGVYYMGSGAYDWLGCSVAPAGDFNNDGIADFLIGSLFADPVINSETRSDTGVAYLIYGSNTSLATTDMLTFVTGSNGVRFVGDAVNDYTGASVAGVGDVNGDGIDDIALGAAYADPQGRGYAGVVYVIYGTTVAYTEDVDMRSYGAFTKGFAVYGSSSNMLNTVAPAGDINGDGVGDILVGGTNANSKAHVVFGQIEERTSNVDTSTADVVTFSYTDGAYLGFALSGGADLNGDGIPDILLGAYQAIVTPENGGVDVASGALWMLPGPFFLTNPTSAPSVVPTKSPSCIPTLLPSAVPSVVPSVSPSVEPSITPSLAPTALPSFIPSAEPSREPSTSPSAVPSIAPSVMPTVNPSIVPSVEPSVAPSLDPTIVPSVAPSVAPSVTPSVNPSAAPSEAPSAAPSIVPTFTPSVNPSVAPSLAPSIVPTMAPSTDPSIVPSVAPSCAPSETPSATPSITPTANPSANPSAAPSAAPSIVPSMPPSAQPSITPSAAPSILPSIEPSVNPSVAPSTAPSIVPTVVPSVDPTFVPSTAPSIVPSMAPSAAPSITPSVNPSVNPSMAPSTAPSIDPTTAPSANPSAAPSAAPSIVPSMAPSAQPSIMPSTAPSAVPSIDPSVIPSVAPSTVPSVTPSQAPSTVPSTMPSLDPTFNPTVVPSESPSVTPSFVPSVEPTFVPSAAPSFVPTVSPSVDPTVEPSVVPTVMPSVVPTAPSVAPSTAPSVAPSVDPTFVPSEMPSVFPTVVPSVHPSAMPSADPTTEPSQIPTLVPTADPTVLPSAVPSIVPSVGPSAAPSEVPSAVPSLMPSVDPTVNPSAAPSIVPSPFPTGTPSETPSVIPSVSPSTNPTIVPSKAPSAVPSTFPSENPTVTPSAAPTAVPSEMPSVVPTLQPSANPSTQPTLQPSAVPSVNPTLQPSMQPTLQPSPVPTLAPSAAPSTQPTLQPSAVPSKCPSASPSIQPTLNPSPVPSIHPTASPSITPSCKPSASPSFRPSPVPSKNSAVAPVLTVTAVYKSRTSITLTTSFATAQSAGVVYCAAMRDAIAPATSGQVVAQGFAVSYLAGATFANVTMSGLLAVEVYHTYCAAVTALGEVSLYADVLTTKQEVETACCKLISCVNCPSFVYGDLTKYTSSSPTTQFVFSYGLTSSPAVSVELVPTLYNSTGSVVPASIVEITPSMTTFTKQSTSLSGTFVLKSSLATTETYTLMMRIAGTDKSAYQSTVTSSVRVLSSFAPPPTPALQSAKFSDSGGAVTVTFSAATNRAGITTPTFACNRLFTFVGVNSTTCSWTSAATVNIVFAASAVNLVEVDGTISLRGGLIKAACIAPAVCTSYLAAEVQSVTVVTADNAVVPSAALRVPALLPSCGDFRIDHTLSSGNGGRPWKSVTWTAVSETDTSPSETDPALLAVLNSLGTSTSAPITVSSALIRAARFTVTLTVQNFFGLSHTATASFTFSENPNTPLLSILGSKTVVLAPKDALRLSTAISRASCAAASSTISYVWTVRKNGVVQSISSVSPNPSRFALNAYTLDALNAYQITVEASASASTNPTFPVATATASVNVQVANGIVAATVEGGSSKSVAQSTGTIDLDASKSQDQSYPAGSTLSPLSYSWTCVLASAAEYGTSCADNLPTARTSSILAIPVTGLTYFVPYLFTVTATASDGRFGSFDVTVQSGPGDTSVVITTTALTKLNPTKKITMLGRVTGGYALDAYWSASVDGEAQSFTASTPTQTTFTYAQALGSIEYPLVMPPNTFPAGSTVVFRLVANQAGDVTLYAAFSEVTVTINAPPSSGVVTVDPSAGSALTQDFSITASSWSDDSTDFPLSFEYSYKVAETQSALTLQSRTSSNNARATLPAGLVSNEYKVLLFCEVFDLFDASATASSSAVVTADANLNVTAYLSDQLAAAESSGDTDLLSQIVANTASTINTANCSLVNATFCASINRASCFATPQRCSFCLSGYSGVAGDQNSMCYVSTASGGAEIGASCNMDAECAHGLICAESTCAVPLLECPTTTLDVCSGQGVCEYFDPNGKTFESPCTVQESNCFARCACIDGYGGASCSISPEDVAARDNARATLCKTIVTISNSDDISFTLLDSIISFLNIAFEPTEVSSDDSKAMCYEALTVLTSYSAAGFLSAKSTTIVVDLVSKFVTGASNDGMGAFSRRYLTDGTSAADTVDQAVSDISLGLLSTLASGEDAIAYSTSELSVQITKAPASTVTALTPPQSGDYTSHIELTSEAASQLQNENGDIEASAVIYNQNPMFNESLQSSPFRLQTVGDAASRRRVSITAASDVVVADFYLVMQFTSKADFNLSLTIEQAVELSAPNFTYPECTYYNGIGYSKCDDCFVSTYTNYNVTYGCPLSALNSGNTVTRMLQGTDEGGDTGSQTIQFGTVFTSVGKNFVKTLSLNPFKINLEKAKTVLSFLSVLTFIILFGFWYFLRWDVIDKGYLIYTKPETDRKEFGVRHEKILKEYQGSINDKTSAKQSPKFSDKRSTNDRGAWQVQTQSERQKRRVSLAQSIVSAFRPASAIRPDGNSSPKRVSPITAPPPPSPRSRRQKLKQQTYEALFDTSNVHTESERQLYISNVVGHFLDSVMPEDSLQKNSEASWSDFALTVLRYHEYTAVFFGASLKYTRTLRWTNLVLGFLLNLFLDTIFYGIFYPDDGTCEIYTTKEDCLSEPSAVSSANLCVWHTDDSGETSCNINPPPGDFVFLILVVMCIVVIAVPLQFFYDFILLTWCMRRPRLEDWGLTSEYWIGRATQTSTTEVRESPIQALYTSIDHYRRVGDATHEATKAENLLAYENFKTIQVYESYMTPEYEANQMLEKAKEFVEANAFTPLIALQRHKSSVMKQAKIEAIAKHLGVDVEGRPVPLTILELLRYGTHKQKLIASLTEARKHSALIQKRLKSFGDAELQNRDSMLMQHFILEHFSLLKQFVLNRHMFDYSVATPLPLHPLLWVLTWSFIFMSIAFFLYWSFAWGIGQGGSALENWSINIGTALAQDLFIIQVFRVYIIYSLAMVSIKPQLQYIYRVLNKVAISYAQDDLEEAFKDIRVCQHLSPSLRTAHTHVADNLAAANILRHIDDSDMAVCKLKYHVNMSTIAMAIFSIPLLVAVFSEAGADVILESILPAALDGALIVNSFFYSAAGLFIMMPYLVILGVYLWKHKVHKPVGKAFAAMQKDEPHEYEISKWNAARRKSNGDSYWSAFVHMSLTFTFYVTRPTTFVQTVMNAMRSKKAQQQDMLWSGMNKPGDMQGCVTQLRPLDRTYSGYGASRLNSRFPLARSFGVFGNPSNARQPMDRTTSDYGRPSRSVVRTFSSFDSPFDDIEEGIEEPDVDMSETYSPPKDESFSMKFAFKGYNPRFVATAPLGSPRQRVYERSYSTHQMVKSGIPGRVLALTCDSNQVHLDRWIHEGEDQVTPAQRAVTSATYDSCYLISMLTHKLTHVHDPAPAPTVPYRAPLAKKHDFLRAHAVLEFIDNHTILYTGEDVVAHVLHCFRKNVTAGRMALCDADELEELTYKDARHSTVLVPYYSLRLLLRNTLQIYHCEKQPLTEEEINDVLLLCYEWISKRGDDFLEVHYDHDTHRIALAVLSRESSADSGDSADSISAAVVGDSTKSASNVAGAAIVRLNSNKNPATAASKTAAGKETTVNTVNDKDEVATTEVNYSVPFNMFRLWFLSMEAAIVRYRDAERTRLNAKI